MSGHSKLAKIKHQKADTDIRKGKTFSKLAKMIAVAASEGGSGDPTTNAKLRIAIEKARALNMPSDNVERAVKRGTGEDKSATQIEEILFEAYGPGGVALLIKAVTDNHKRTLAEIRHILAEHGGKLGESGSVRWMFELKGIVYLPKDTARTEEWELAMIDAGADDIRLTDDALELVAQPEKLELLKQTVRTQGNTIDEANLEWIAKNPVQPDPATADQLEKLFAALDENDDVAEVYSG